MNGLSENAHPGFVHSAVPPQYREHPRVRGALFFTLPEPLLGIVADNVGAARFDPDLWAMEVALTRACGPSDGVGFWAGKRIFFPQLRCRQADVTLNMVESLGWTLQQIENVNTVGRERTERLAGPARGYAGWLLTNRQFLKEHDSLFRSWRAETAQHGVPVFGATMAAASRFPEAAHSPESRTEQCLAAFEEFTLRWRLSGLAAPRLPQPLQPQLSALTASSVLRYMRGGGQVFCFPDIYPVPTRDELRDMIEDALRGAEIPQHLAEWMDKVRADNASRNTITRYCRLFEVQHYLRALYQRHADALHLRKGALGQAFATFLQVSTDTIAGDLAFIAEQLGEEWFLATSESALQNP